MCAERVGRAAQWEGTPEGGWVDVVPTQPWGLATEADPVTPDPPHWGPVDDYAGAVESVPLWAVAGLAVAAWLVCGLSLWGVVWLGGKVAEWLGLPLWPAG